MGTALWPWRFPCGSEVRGPLSSLAARCGDLLSAEGARGGVVLRCGFALWRHHGLGLWQGRAQKPAARSNEASSGGVWRAGEGYLKKETGGMKGERRRTPCGHNCDEGWDRQQWLR